jgi:hypothetical protein
MSTSQSTPKPPIQPQVPPTPTPLPQRRDFGGSPIPKPTPLFTKKAVGNIPRPNSDHKIKGDT